MGRIRLGLKELNGLFPFSTLSWVPACRHLWQFQDVLLGHVALFVKMSRLNYSVESVHPTGAEEEYWGDMSKRQGRIQFRAYCDGVVKAACHFPIERSLAARKFPSNHLDYHWNERAFSVRSLRRAAVNAGSVLCLTNRVFRTAIGRERLFWNGIVRKAAGGDCSIVTVFVQTD